MAFVVLEI